MHNYSLIFSVSMLYIVKAFLCEILTRIPVSVHVRTQNEAKCTLIKTDTRSAEICIFEIGNPIFTSEIFSRRQHSRK